VRRNDWKWKPVSSMRRREFIKLLGGAAALSAWPLTVRSQSQQPIRLIGVLSGTAESDPQAKRRIATFSQALRETGWEEGTNIKLETRYSAGHPERLTALAVELVQAKCVVLVAEVAQAVDAARAATRTIPIVMVYVGDALGPGYVASLARPGGNITGQTLVATDQAAKRLELIKKVSPDIKRIAVLSNLNASGHVRQRKEMDAAAPALGIELQQLPLQSASEFDAKLQAVLEGGAQAIVTMEDPMVESARARITGFALSHRLLVMGEFKPMAEAGALMSYGPNQVAMWGRTAYYVDKILKGANPANLPVEQPAKFELTVNLKTAKALGVDIPPTVLALSDIVIE
jgi:putative tryptophan/tyrosine transport system substrate-binding protein